ncbi:UNVERIFIED_ORG: 2-keto-4-pentenoate hydratase/2-oxohepta-3-ene-1,7-dioic acid hydratase in catechol pathway [Paraburkholderia sediminicola]|nr:2-keto-4-pentenoate hydratase/2-oxohepta-3-ene-1,7-dioic acid hydratase in catechol pathway [Paraburkholderia sediminicola]
MTDGDSGILDVRAACERQGMTAPFDVLDMLSLIQRGAVALEFLDGLLRRDVSRLALSDVRLLAPIPRPRKNIFCVGWNYIEHFAEGERIRPHVKEMPQYPTFFTKAPTTVNGPYDPIPYFSHLSEQLDWEVEIGIIIGNPGRDITEAHAADHIFGFTVLNDLTWRDVQRRHGQQWFKGKSIDGTCPMGPWITVASDVDVSSLGLTCRVNGVLKQQSNSSYLYFKIPAIISELSRGLTLEAGDVIATGTPAGVGHARTPPEFMKPGDIVETEVVGLGRLENRIGTP